MESVLFCILPFLAASLTVPAVMGRLRRDGAARHPVFVWLTWVLPFAAGGFYTYMAVPVSALLLWFLRQRLRERKCFCFFRNRASISVLALTAGYALTPLWAADKGMAPFGLIRFLPVLLLVLLLMQLDEEERRGMLCLVPVTGAVMTALSLGLLLIPGLSGFLSVNGRLAGFLQYPNTFALFLLAGLLVHQQKTERGWAASALDGSLMLGIFLSGSRTAFLLFLFTVAMILLRHRNMKTTLRFSGLSLISGGIALVISRLGLLDGASRLSSISVSSGTFLARLLYFRDALSVIPTHPFGVGYWGWRAMQGSIQTGRYSVSFIHNGLLQLMMDVGWIPALLLAWCFLGLLLGKRTPWHKRLLLAAVLGHCILDFDMQFLAVWVILIAQMDLTEGKLFSFHKIQRPGAVAGAFLLGLSLWLGIADVCMQAGAVNACLAVTPFHTQALTQSLKQIADPEELDTVADCILEANPYSSIAYSAKANAALSQGDITAMISYKQKALDTGKYSMEDYCDYISKLYAVYRIYVQNGDSYSAEYCRQQILRVPAMLRDVEARTSALADLTSDDSSMTLPEEIMQLVEALAAG